MRIVTRLLLLMLALPLCAAAQSHALIIGVGQYTQASESTPLLGVPKDMEVARRMAIAMGIPSNQIINKESSAHGLDHPQATRTFESINNTKIGRY
jgi:hypothetical protein